MGTRQPRLRLVAAKEHREHKGKSLNPKIGIHVEAARKGGKSLSHGDTEKYKEVKGFLFSPSASPRLRVKFCFRFHLGFGVRAKVGLSLRGNLTLAGNKMTRFLTKARHSGLIIKQVNAMPEGYARGLPLLVLQSWQHQWLQWHWFAREPDPPIPSRPFRRRHCDDGQV